jgi:hypothetical protein
MQIPKQLLLGGVFFLSALTLQAQTLFSSPSGNFLAGFTNSTLGSTFTVGPQSITVTALGAFDDFQNGNFRNHDVGLWGSSGLLGSVTVPIGTGGALIGDYRYINLSSSITLAANTTYTIGAFFDIPGGIPFDDVGESGTSLVGAGISSANPMLFDGFSVNPSLTQPTLTFFDTLWAANMIYSVPEPSSWGLFGTGLLLLSFRRKHSSRPA